jgi:hypothetical protein
VPSIAEPAALAAPSAHPILFHVVGEASRLTLHGKGALAVLNPLIGERSLVRVEADVELSKLTYNLTFREDGVYWSISQLRMQLARDGDLRCHSAEGGVVEWLLRAIPAKVLHWIETALQTNLAKEQQLAQWQGDAHELGALDGLLNEIERLERLQEEARRRYGKGFGRAAWS